MVETLLLKHLSNKSQLRHENIECRVAEMYVCEGKVEETSACEGGIVP